MPDRPVQVSSKSLVKTGVTMDVVAEQLAELRKLIEQDCRLLVLALGGVGIFACGRYNGGCDDVDTKLNALRTEAVTIANGMGKAAVGYVSAEVANLRAIEQAAESADSAGVPYSGRVASDVAGGFLSASWLAGLGLHKALQRQMAEAAAHMESVSAEVDDILDAATTVWKEQMENAAESWCKDVAKDVMDRPVGEKLLKQMAAEDRISRIAELSQRTDAVLKTTRGFNIAATAASVMWTVEALVMADDLIDGAIGSWHGVAAGARTIFHEWRPAISLSMFPEWTGKASTAAERRLAAFMSDGTAVVDRAEQMASSLHTVVVSLNDLHGIVFAFAMTQLAVMLALMATAWVNPTVAMLLQSLGALLNVWVTIGVNAILAVLGALVALAAA
ncbi:hypothetical protein [Actinopolymorpha pittospori]